MYYIYELLEINYVTSNFKKLIEMYEMYDNV